jgi:hypothetical protein
MSDPETLSTELSRAFERLREALSLKRIASEAEVWLYGLSRLEDAEGRLATVQKRLWSLADWKDQGPIEPMKGPEVDEAVRSYATTETEYHYHELALFALAQPLLEGLAVAVLGDSASTRPPGSTARHPLHWPELMVRLEAHGGEALARAREVEVRLLFGRDRLVAHAAPHHISVRQMDGDGAIVRTGRVALASEERLAAEPSLRELNESLAAEDRSSETNLGEIARDLIGHAAILDAEQRKLLGAALLDLGFEVPLRDACRSLIGFVEALPALLADPRWSGPV